jgi:hypothetical protein
VSPGGQVPFGFRFPSITLTTAVYQQDISPSLRSYILRGAQILCGTGHDLSRHDSIADCRNAAKDYLPHHIYVPGEPVSQTVDGQQRAGK